MPSMRCSSSARRSSIAGVSPLARPASRSRRLAARMAGACARIASAAARSASSLSSRGLVARTAAAARARRPMASMTSVKGCSRTVAIDVSSRFDVWARIAANRLTKASLQRGSAHAPGEVGGDRRPMALEVLVAEHRLRQLIDARHQLGRQWRAPMATAASGSTKVKMVKSTAPVRGRRVSVCRSTRSQSRLPTSAGADVAGRAAQGMARLVQARIVADRPVGPPDRVTDGETLEEQPDRAADRRLQPWHRRMNVSRSAGRSCRRDSSGPERRRRPRPADSRRGPRP